MAYESFDDFFAGIKVRYNDKDATVREQFLILSILGSMYDKICVGKLKTQKGTVKRLIQELNPHYAIGYFGKPKKKES